MSKFVVIVGDSHFDIKEPHFSAAKEFVKWFLETPFNNSDNIFVHLGDLYHHSNPNPKIHELGIEWISKIKCKTKFLMAGNHDYNRLQNSYSIDPLSKIEGVRLVKSPSLQHYKDFSNSDFNFSFLFLPYIYNHTPLLENETLKEYYESIHNRLFECSKADFIFHHVEDETIQFGGEYNGINLSNLKGERIGGHIHKQQKGYLGSALITRYDEREKESFILLIDIDTKEKEYIKVPQFLDYHTIDYSEQITDYKFFNEQNNCEYNVIFDIVNAPSREAAEEKFKGLFIREIKLKDNETDLVLNEQESKDTKTIRDWFDLFCEKNKISKSIKEKLVEYL